MCLYEIFIYNDSNLQHFCMIIEWIMTSVRYTVTQYLCNQSVKEGSSKTANYNCSVVHNQFTSIRVFIFSPGYYSHIFKKRR